MEMGMTEMNKGLGKRLLCGLLALMLLTGIAPALAEEEEAVSEAELEEILALDEVDESAYNVTGKVWHEKTKEDFTPSSPALYRAKLSSVPGMRPDLLEGRRGKGPAGNDRHRRSETADREKIQTRKQRQHRIYCKEGKGSLRCMP